MTRSRPAFDAAEYQPSGKKAAVISSEPDLFNQPFAHASESSKAAADAVSDASDRSQKYDILLHLATLEPHDTVSRAWLNEVTRLPISTLCARLDVLRKDGYVERVKNACRSNVKPDTLAVDGFRITQSGRQRLERAA